METSLILFSGLPGTGKSSLAEALARRCKIPVFTKDYLQTFFIRHKLVSQNTIDGYLQMFDLADKQLSLGISVILDAVFPLPGFRGETRLLAEFRQAQWKPIYCTCSDDALREARWRERMVGEVPGESRYTAFNWEDFQKVEAEFQPWQPDEALFVDAVHPFEENLTRILEYLKV